MRLNRTILTLGIAALMLTATPAAHAFEAENVAEIQQPSVNAVTITVNNNSDNQEVRVQNAEGLRLEIYNLLGVKVASLRIDSADKTFTLNLGRGCYLLKVGKVVRKTFLR